MDIAALLDELFGRVAEHVHEAVDGLDADALVATPAPGTNSIGWLVWHLTRVQDHHVSELVDEPQQWVTGPWAPRFGLEPDPDNTGYGHGPADVERVRPDGPEALVGYYEAVATRTGTYLATLTPRPRPHRRRALGPARDARGAAREHRRRRHPARRTGGVRPRPPRPRLIVRPAARMPA